MPVESGNARPPRRVLMLVNQLTGGGTERNVKMLCRHADRSRYAPEVWTLIPDREGSVDENTMGVPIRCLQRKNIYDPRFALRTAWDISRAQVDVIHVFLPAIAFYAALAKKLFGTRAPIVYSEATDMPAQGWAGVRHRWNLRQFTAFAANSSGSRRHLQHEGVPEDKIAVIPNGHDVSIFQPPADERQRLRGMIRSQLGLADTEVVAITVGRLIPTKRVNDGIDALAMLSEQHPNLRLLVVGIGAEQAALVNQVSRLGLSNRVLFLGKRHDVPHLLQAVDLCLFPSEVEGLPNSVIEAALSGLPIVACDIPGIWDIVGPGHEDWVVPCRQPTRLAAAVAKILTHRADAAEHAHEIQQRAMTKFSIRDVVRQWCNYYDRILSP